MLPLWEAVHRLHPILFASAKQIVCSGCLPADFNPVGRYLLDHKESPGSGLVSSPSLIKLQAPTQVCLETMQQVASQLVLCSVFRRSGRGVQREQSARA